MSIRLVYKNPYPHILRKTRLKLRYEELCRDDDVVENNKVTAKTVAGAELCQHQVQLVHAGKRRQERREGMIVKTNIRHCKTYLLYL